jgi:hypothetical protein
MGYLSGVNEAGDCGGKKEELGGEGGQSKQTNRKLGNKAKKHWLSCTERNMANKPNGGVRARYQTRRKHTEDGMKVRRRAKRKQKAREKMIALKKRIATMIRG